MELRHLRYFLRAAELSHFTRAAESLYISQPSLSIYMQQLEEEIGAALFARVGRNVRLTEAGRLLRTHASKIIHEFEKAQQGIDDLKGLLRGTLRFGSLLAFSGELVPIWLSTFNKMHPEVHVICRTGPHAHLEDLLLKGDIELVLAFLPIESTEIEFHELFTEEVVLVVPEVHELAQRELVRLADLEKVPLSLPSQQQNTRRLLDDLFIEYGVTPKITAEVDDLHALLTMVKMGNAVSVLSRMAVADGRGVKCVSFVGGPEHRLTAIAMWDKRTTLTPAAKAFLEVVKMHCQPDD
jgi:LysR family cyn operon transcriptional activator